MTKTKDAGPIPADPSKKTIWGHSSKVEHSLWADSVFEEFSQHLAG